MIHLANDPNAGRPGYQPAQSESKGGSIDHPRSRGGHAWPFPSRYAVRPAPQNTTQSIDTDSIS